MRGLHTVPALVPAKEIRRKKKKGKKAAGENEGGVRKYLPLPDTSQAYLCAELTCKVVQWKYEFRLSAVHYSYLQGWDFPLTSELDTCVVQYLYSGLESPAPEESRLIEIIRPDETSLKP